MEFDSSEEAKWVLENGSRIYKGDVMHLECEAKQDLTLGFHSRVDKGRIVLLLILDDRNQLLNLQNNPNSQA